VFGTQAEFQPTRLKNCGHVFHRGCIQLWIPSHSNCPQCRAPNSMLDLQDDFILKSIVEQLISTNQLPKSDNQIISSRQIENPISEITKKKLLQFMFIN